MTRKRFQLCECQLLYPRYSDDGCDYVVRRRAVMLRYPDADGGVVVLPYHRRRRAARKGAVRGGAVVRLKNVPIFGRVVSLCRDGVIVIPQTSSGNIVDGAALCMWRHGEYEYIEDDNP